MTQKYMEISVLLFPRPDGPDHLQSWLNHPPANNTAKT